MSLTSLNSVLAMAPAPTKPGEQPDPTGQMVQMVFMFAILGVMFYFLLFRPQQKKAKEQAALLKTIKPGDKIVTASGIVGVVVTVKERTLTIRSADTKMEIIKSAAAEITERAGESSAP